MNLSRWWVGRGARVSPLMEGDTCEEGKAKGPLPVLTNYTRTHPSMGYNGTACANLWRWARWKEF